MYVHNYMYIIYKYNNIFAPLSLSLCWSEDSSFKLQNIKKKKNYNSHNTVQLNQVDGI